MSIWGLTSSYQPQIQPLFGCGGYNSMNFSMPSLFGFGVPRYNVFNNNIFGFTPPTNFCYMPQLDFNQTYMQPIDLTFGLFNYSAQQAQLPAKGLFDFLNITKKSSTHSVNTNLPSLREAGYNETKAKKLAQTIAGISTENGFDNHCAKHVKDSIEAAGLGAYKNGHAYQMPQILAANKNFKEISAKGLNLSKLPAGCILVYDRGVSGYSSEYGHTEITLGNGTAGSGGITHNIRSGARVFVPV